ncbi:MAG TPA: hydroxyacid dehydrogenase [Synergistaceae bacterium]|nr:hydroxyacid dehydrogenase [Synergistaceae bacterium]
MLILMAESFGPSLPERLQAFGDVTEDMARLEEAEVLLVRSKTKCPRDFLEKAPKLKLIIRGGVGLDNVDRETAKERGIKVHNTPRASSIAVAEETFALMLAVPTHLVEGHLSMSQGKWEKKALKRTELYGKTLGLLGMGNIATEVALRAQAFGMKVLGYRKSGKSSPAAEVLSNMTEVLRQSDYLSLHLPLTEETRGLIRKETIEKMKDGVVLINTARGDIVDAKDVLSALESRKISWYCTDVWPKDPPQEDYPLLGAPHVLMAPHLGASTVENMLRIGDEIVAILENNVKEGLL